MESPVAGCAMISSSSEPAISALERVTQAYDSCLRRALKQAVVSGELAKATPIEDLSCMLRVMLLSCPPMTQDSGSFTEIENPCCYRKCHLGGGAGSCN